MSGACQHAAVVAAHRTRTHYRDFHTDRTLYSSGVTHTSTLCFAGCRLGNPVCRSLLFASIARIAISRKVTDL
jgi:hypothetical protein